MMEASSSCDSLTETAEVMNFRVVQVTSSGPAVSATSGKRIAVVNAALKETPGLTEKLE